MPELNLPDEVRVLDLGSCVVEFALSGKVVFVAKDASGIHLTFHPGGKSGFADIHITRPGATDPHETLYAMSHLNLAALGDLLPPQFEALIERIVRRTCRRVRPGWLRHHGILAMPMVPLGPDGLLALGRRLGKRFILDPSRFEASITETMRGFELRAAPDGPYLLFLKSQPSELPFGVLVKFTGALGRLGFIWFKTSKLIAELSQVWAELRPAIESSLAGPDELARLRALVGPGADRPE